MLVTHGEMSPEGPEIPGSQAENPRSCFHCRGDRQNSGLGVRQAQVQIPVSLSSCWAFGEVFHVWALVFALANAAYLQG